MRRIRVIPVLTIDGARLVKTVKFKKPNYIGDPINAIKIFNEKEVDEIAVLDITASLLGKEPNYRLIEEMAGECFMPLGYGGGVRTVQAAQRLFNSGVEKIIINTAIGEGYDLVSQLAGVYGSQSVVACVDVKKRIFGGQLAWFKSGRNSAGCSPVQLAVELEKNGTGEIILNNIDREGTFSGYDCELIREVASSVKVPVVACGGASRIEDIFEAVKAGASAVAASSIFIYKANNTQSILINYPTQPLLKEHIYSRL